ncbi:MAG: hypothetical protein ACLVJ6_02810 [Merdibacter sp.]
MIAALNTGFFQLLAHPDVIMVNYEQPTPLLLEHDRIFAECRRVWCGTTAKACAARLAIRTPRSGNSEAP